MSLFYGDPLGGSGTPQSGWLVGMLTPTDYSRYYNSLPTIEKELKMFPLQYSTVYTLIKNGAGTTGQYTQLRNSQPYQIQAGIPTITNNFTGGITQAPVQRSGDTVSSVLNAASMYLGSSRLPMPTQLALTPSTNQVVSQAGVSGIGALPQGALFIGLVIAGYLFFTRGKKF